MLAAVTAMTKLLALLLVACGALTATPRTICAASASSCASAWSRRRRCSCATAACRRPRSRSARASGWAKDFFDAESFLDPLFNGANIERFLNANYAQVDDPEINRALDLANALSDPVERARLYAQVDRRATDQAYVIPWLWETSIPLRARDVKGVASRFTAGWDLTFTAVQ